MVMFIAGKWLVIWGEEDKYSLFKRIKTRLFIRIAYLITNFVAERGVIGTSQDELERKASSERIAIGYALPHRKRKQDNTLIESSKEDIKKQK